jgi:hypothetical protein
MAIEICIAMISNTYFQQVIIARILIEAEEKDVSECTNSIMQDLETSIKLLKHVGFLIVPFAFLFYLFFIFDIYGTTEDLAFFFGILLLISVSFISFLFFLVFKYFAK